MTWMSGKFLTHDPSMLNSVYLEESDTALWYHIQFPRQEPEAKKKKENLNIWLVRHSSRGMTFPLDTLVMYHVRINLDFAETPNV